MDTLHAFLAGNIFPVDKYNAGHYKHGRQCWGPGFILKCPYSVATCNLYMNGIELCFMARRKHTDLVYYMKRHKAYHSNPQTWDG